MTDRLDRIDELMKREISVILQEDIEDPLVRSVTITKVEVARDLSVAKVFYVVFGDKKEKDSVARGLRRAAGFIRGRIAREISLKAIPRISFLQDKSEEREEEIEKLFGLIEKEHGSEEGRQEEREQDEQ